MKPSSKTAARIDIMEQKKTDNGNFEGKLELRRYFLDKYRCTSVFDCCQGDKKIWNILQNEYSPEKYFGVDLKPKKGRLQIDSKRILDQTGWDFDVIDIDTYGSPWGHWQSVLEYGNKDITVFLTIGLVRIMGGRISSEVSSWLGFSSFLPKMPTSLAAKCNMLSLPYCLNQVEKYGYSIIEALEAPATKNAGYIGVRIKKHS